MTYAQIDLAQKMAKRCEESNYKQCGEPQDAQFSVSETSVPMRMEGGTYVVPVLINGAITLDFVVDSGAADVSIPADVVMTLMRTGTLKVRFSRRKNICTCGWLKGSFADVSY